MFCWLQPELHLQSRASSNRQSIHLAMTSGNSTDSESLPPLPTIHSGDAILLEVTHSTEAVEADVHEAGSPDAADPRSLQRNTANRHFVLIQPDVIVIEEETCSTELKARNPCLSTVKPAG